MSDRKSKSAGAGSQPAPVFVSNMACLPGGSGLFLLEQAPAGTCNRSWRHGVIMIVHMKKEQPVPGTVGEYIETLDAAAAQSLQKTRKQLLAAVPGVTELISYQIPTVKYRDAPLLAYAAYPKHCSLYTMSKAVMERYSTELSGYKKTATAVHFAAGTTLPEDLLLKIIADRMAETDFMLQQREDKKMARRMAARKGRS